MRKPRPQDEWNAAQIERAVAFSASIFFNGRHNAMRFATRREAEAMARRMTAAAGNGRKASVYAITPEGFTVFVCNPSEETAPMTEKLYSTKSNAKRAAAKIEGATVSQTPAGMWAVTAPSVLDTYAAEQAAAEAPDDGFSPPAFLAKDAVANPVAPRDEPAPAPAKPAKRLGKKAAADAEAAAGAMPTPPDFSAPTHKAWRKRLDSLVAMAAAGDVAGLKADTTEPKSSSRVMLCRYRDLAIKALEAR